MAHGPPPDPKPLSHWVSQLYPDDPTITVLHVAVNRHYTAQKTVVYKDHNDKIWHEDLSKWHIFWKQTDTCSLAYCIYPDES